MLMVSWVLQTSKEQQFIATSVLPAANRNTAVSHMGWVLKPIWLHNVSVHVRGAHGRSRALAGSRFREIECSQMLEPLQYGTCGIPGVSRNQSQVKQLRSVQAMPSPVLSLQLAQICAHSTEGSLGSFQALVD